MREQEAWADLKAMDGAERAHLAPVAGSLLRQSRDRLKLYQEDVAQRARLARSRSASPADASAGVAASTTLDRGATAAAVDGAHDQEQDHGADEGHDQAPEEAAACAVGVA